MTHFLRESLGKHSSSPEWDFYQGSSVSQGPHCDDEELLRKLSDGSVRIENCGIGLTTTDDLVSDFHIPMSFGDGDGNHVTPRDLDSIEEAFVAGYLWSSMFGP